MSNYSEASPTDAISKVASGQFNLYTGNWQLGRDPTFIDDLYDSRSIGLGNLNYNYVRYSDAQFDAAARGLKSATTLSEAIPFAHAAELRYNSTLPVLDVWTTLAAVAFRIFHSDPDPILNGKMWTGYWFQIGRGFDNSWTWMNVQLKGAPLHDPNHPVIIKWGWKVASTS